jgi:hypothetical protein
MGSIYRDLQLRLVEYGVLEHLVQLLTIKTVCTSSYPRIFLNVSTLSIYCPLKDSSGKRQRQRYSWNKLHQWVAASIVIQLRSRHGSALLIGIPVGL